MSNPNLFSDISLDMGSLPGGLSVREFAARQAEQQHRMTAELRARERMAMEQVKYDAMAESYSGLGCAFASEQVTCNPKSEPKKKKSPSKVLLLCPA